jgi:hypothetical protein
MKTFVAEGVLTDFTDGLVVVKAANMEEAVKLINDVNSGLTYYEDEVISALRELKDNEIVFVRGGGDY